MFSDIHQPFPPVIGAPRAALGLKLTVRTPARGRSAVAAAVTSPPPDESDSSVETEEQLAPAARSELACRVFNVVVAVLLLVLTLPLSILAAILVKLTSPGPVLYTQTRVGIDRRWNRSIALRDNRREDLGGEQFTIYKFRSMRTDAETNGEAVWAQQNDARVTPIGKIIRATRIDELPQLYNVLRGEMNIVGPRPERPSIFVRLREDIENYPMRQRVRPGITGWAQINRSYDTDIEGVREKLSLDLEYLRDQSIWTDLRILAKTVPVILLRKGGW